jgi:hypothetical protein
MSWANAPMTYHAFENLLLLALLDAADASDHGLCEAFRAAGTVLPQVKDQWVRDAVRSYEQRNYLRIIFRPLEERLIHLQISGEARKAAERLRAEKAAGSPRSR